VRAIVLERFGGPEVLEVRDFPDPEPPADGYVVEARAIAVNFAETVERRGVYRKEQPLPYPLGKEAAGVVVARGPEARRFREGDPVIVVKFDNGCYAERIACREDQVLRPPAGLDFREMAAFATAFATAWYSQEEIARARPGDAVLIQAAAGGVGTAAVLLARSRGLAPVLGTAGGPEKCALVEGLGADRCVDYRREDFREAVRQLTGDRGADYILESVGGQVYEHSLEVLAPMGRLVIIGFSALRDDYGRSIPRLHPLTLFHRSIAVGGLNIDNLKFQRRREVWDRLVAHAEEHGLRPVLGPAYPLAEAAAAHAALESRATTGKLLLLP